MLQNDSDVRLRLIIEAIEETKMSDRVKTMACKLLKALHDEDGELLRIVTLKLNESGYLCFRWSHVEVSFDQNGDLAVRTLENTNHYFPSYMCSTVAEIIRRKQLPDKNKEALRQSLLKRIKQISDLQGSDENEKPFLSDFFLNFEQTLVNTKSADFTEPVIFPIRIFQPSEKKDKRCSEKVSQG